MGSPNGPIFSRHEFAEMARILRGLRVTFILSLNDVPEVREIFAGFTIEPVRTPTSSPARFGASAS